MLDITIKPFGVHAILVEWPTQVNETILNSILQFETFLKKEHLVEEDWETVPAYNSLLLLNRNIVLDYKTFSKKVAEWYTQIEDKKIQKRYLWRLPVFYDVEYGIDLVEVARALNKTIAEVIALHTSYTYTVYGIGFLPGFMYLGGLPKELEVSRKATPRLKVAKGAVGLAGKQTGIYPQESPGGWNIIGNCTVPIFNSENEQPCFVNVGDKIQFYQVSKAAYNLHKIEAEVGIYKLNKTAIDD